MKKQKIGTQFQEKHRRNAHQYIVDQNVHFIDKSAVIPIYLPFVEVEKIDKKIGAPFV